MIAQTGRKDEHLSTTKKGAELGFDKDFYWKKNANLNEWNGESMNNSKEKNVNWK